MADNDSPETGGEPAELSLEDVVARRTQAAQAEPQEQDESEDELQDKDTSEDEATTEENTEEDDSEDVVEAEEADDEPETKDDVLIKLDDGSTVTVAALKAEASTLKAENTRMSQEVAKERRDLQQMGQSVSSTFDKVVEYLASKLPPEPDQQLLWSDAARHHQMTYLRNIAIQELQSLLEVKGAVDGVTDQISEADFKRYEADENAKLIQAVPNLKDPARMKAAMSKVHAYAKSIGYDDETISKTKDARLLQMAMDAAYGREARQAAAKAKAQVKSSGVNSPPTRSVHPNSMNALKVQNAVKRAKQSGSIDDVLAARMARQGR